ncbi:hypothetical protein EE612_004281 [Oryza sativa]|nr:hypothetical protein EE612_004281 [Oryza sativa]
MDLPKLLFTVVLLSSQLRILCRCSIGG